REDGSLRSKPVYRITRPSRNGRERPRAYASHTGNCLKEGTQEMLWAGAGTSDSRTEAQPFLKWAGGKAQLLDQFDPFFPRTIGSYLEPFIGGGAVFFHLKARFPKMRARLRDNNAELVNCYRVVRDHVQGL